MSNLVLFIVLGLGSGALIAALGLGVALTYRGAGVVDFAAGAIALYTGYVYWDLRTNGSWPVPPLPNPLALIEGVAGWFGGNLDLPSWPTSVTFGQSLSSPPALAIALATAAGVGLVIHLLVYRPLRAAPALGKVVASIGVLLTIQAIIVRRFGTQPQGVPSLLPNSSIRLLGQRAPIDRLWLALIVLTCAAGLAVVFRFTRLGWTMRAALESEPSAILVAIDPSRLAAGTWIVSSTLMGLVGILVAPITQLNPTLLPSLVVPALGAALVGGMTSFPITALAGLAIGALQSLITLYQTKSWWPHSGAQPVRGVGDLVVIAVIIAAVLLRGSRLPTRGSVAQQRLPTATRSRRPLRSLAPVFGLAVVAALFTSFGLRQALTMSVISAVFCLSMVVMTGYVGQVALSQMAIAGVAAFTLSKLGFAWQLGFPWAPALAIIVAAALGVLASLPALRVRGIQLAVMTLAAGVAIEAFVFANPSLNGGSQGAKVATPALFGVNFGPNSPFFVGDGTFPTPGFGLACIAVLALACTGVISLRKHRLGRAMLAVRVNERAAAAAGVDVMRTKLVAVTIASLLAGTGGALIAYASSVVSAGSFGFLVSLQLVAIAYIGGIGGVPGALIGGLFASGGLLAYAMQNWAHLPSEFVFLLGGIGVILTTVLNPSGIATGVRATIAKLRTAS